MPMTMNISLPSTPRQLVYFACQAAPASAVSWSLNQICLASILEGVAVFRNFSSAIETGVRTTPNGANASNHLCVIMQFCFTWSTPRLNSSAIMLYFTVPQSLWDSFSWFIQHGGCNVSSFPSTAVHFLPFEKREEFTHLDRVQTVLPRIIRLIRTNQR